MRVTVRGGGWEPLVSCLAILATLGSGACGNTRRNGVDPASGGSTTGGFSGSTGGSASTTGGAGTVAGTAASELEAVPSELHRLNKTEYAATVEDVLGAKAPPLQIQSGEIVGFDNIPAALTMDADTFSRFLDAGEAVAEQVFANADLKGRFVTCQAQDDSTCVGDVITAAGLRIFRRPLLEAETPIYQRVYEEARERGDLHEAALKQVLIALLASAQFLYRMELVNEQAGTVPLGPYEVASRLSYLLWSSAPDDDLLGAAELDSLTDDQQLEAQLSRMWDDPKSARFIESFSGQWLLGRRLADHAVFPETHAQWTPEVATAAAGEVSAFFDDLVRTDRDYLELFSSPLHFVNEPLAKLYGTTASGADLQRVSFDTNGRAGYLGLVGFLTATSMPGRSSPTHRGTSIVTNLLCLEIPPPPVDIPNLEVGEPEAQTFRERVEHISDDPVCASCHRQVDPLGLALENYDAVGQYRTQYENGDPIDASVTLKDGTTVDGLPDVIAWLKEQPTAPTCAVQKLYTYGLGRVPADVDTRNIDALARDWQSGNRTVKEAVRRIVLSKPFRFRSDGGLPP
jgi:hypothetical protein